MDGSPPAAPRPRYGRFALGFALAVALAGVLAESYLQVFPPAELHRFLGDASPLRGHLVPDGDFGARFPNLEALTADNPRCLGPGSLLRQERGAGSLDRPRWLVVGNSFGFNLAGRLTTTRTDLAIATLDRRQNLPIRMAQIRALAEGGVKLDRVLLVLTPVDFGALGDFGLARHAVNVHGGEVIVPRLPSVPGVSELVQHSRLAFMAWAHFNRHRDHPRFRLRHLESEVPDHLQKDLTHLFTALARVCRQHELDLSVVLVPMRGPVTARRGFALEDFLVELGRRTGLDILDPRPAFLAHPRPRELYIADGHLSAEGDDLVLAEVARRSRPSVPVAIPVSRGGSRP